MPESKAIERKQNRALPLIWTKVKQYEIDPVTDAVTVQTV